MVMNSSSLVHGLVAVFATVSLLCSLDVLLLPPHRGEPAPDAPIGAAGAVLAADTGPGHTEGGRERGVVSMRAAAARVRWVYHFGTSWLAWPSVAETLVGSVLLLRLAVCERELGSPQIAAFLCAVLVLSFAAALAFSRMTDEDVFPPMLRGLGSVHGRDVVGWAPSAVYSALMVRRLVEMPAIPIVGSITDKSLDMILALQVRRGPTNHHARMPRTIRRAILNQHRILMR
jgi:hypothetical protein